MAKRVQGGGSVSKIKAGFWSGVGIALAAIVVGAAFAFLRPKLPFTVPA